MAATANASANQHAGGDGPRDQLRELIRRRSFSEGEAKRLASGRTSNFYFNMKRTMSLPEGLALIADLMLDEIYKEPCDYVSGLEMGAIPIVNAIALRSHSRPEGKPIPLFWVRKKAKEHGTMQRLEGEDLDVLRGKTAIMVEDVTTTGGSVLQAIEEARENGINVSTVITIVDRLEGAAETLAANGITLKCLFNADDFRS